MSSISTRCSLAVADGSAEAPGQRILVVIPCLNEVDHLARVVTGLIGGNVPSMKIVIVDGGSTDGSVELCRELSARLPEVSWLHNPHRIQSAGINLAVKEFGGRSEFMIRVDAHADYPCDYCRILVEEAEATNAASVVVSMTTVGNGWFQRAVAAAQNSKLGNGGAAHRQLSNDGMWTDHGHHALIRIDAFTRVGGYDESFTHNEDAELDIRLRRRGFTIWLTGRTVIGYHPRSSPLALFRQYVNWGLGRARTMIKHRARPRLRQLLMIAILPASLLSILSPWIGAAATPLILWTSVCILYGIGLALKDRDPSALAAGPAAMIMHLGYSTGFWTTVLRKIRTAVSFGEDLS